MKRNMFTSGLTLAFVFFAFPAWAYTISVGSASWRNQGGFVYDSTGALYIGDDFNGAAGTPLTSPPYVKFYNPPITQNGDGTVSLSASDDGSADDQEVNLPNFNSSGEWLTAYDADFVVNFQTAPPPPGYGFTIEIDTEGQGPSEDDQVALSTYTTHDGSKSVLVFKDDNTTHYSPLTMMTFSDLGISGFSSLGLRLSVDGDGVCTPYYWANPSDGILDFDDINWIQFGTATSQLDMSKFHDDISFQVRKIPPVPLPAPILLLGAGLVGLVGLRKKFKK